MAKPLSAKNVIEASLGRTLGLIRPSVPYGLLFVAAIAILVLAAGTLPEGATGFILFSGLSFATLYAYSLFSSSMYRVGAPTQVDLFRAAWKLSLAWLLVIVIAAIALTFIVLFFSLVGASLGVVAGESGEEIIDMSAQMRANGTFWPLFGMFVFTLIGLFWFCVRLMTFAAATVAKGAVHVFRSWAWTKGNAAVLMPSSILLFVLPTIACVVLISHIPLSVFGGLQSPVSGAARAALATLVLFPSFWIGHGFTSVVAAELMPEKGIDP